MAQFSTSPGARIFVLFGNADYPVFPLNNGGPLHRYSLNALASLLPTLSATAVNPAYQLEVLRSVELLKFAIADYGNSTTLFKGA